MRHLLQLAAHARANVRVIVAVAGAPPRGNAVDEFPAVAEHDARSEGALDAERRGRGFHLGIGQPHMRGIRHSRTVASFSAVSSASIAASSTLRVIEMRSRAVPGGTVGGRIARTANPAARSFAAISSAGPLSPTMNGKICEPGEERP